MSERSLRPYALCGVIAPVLFAGLVAVEGSLVRGYSHVSQPISDLGAYALYGSYALVQDANFWIFGVLVVLLAFGLSRSPAGSRAITAPMGVFGAMIFLAGVFPDQPSPWPGAAHGLVSVAAFISIIASQFFAWRRWGRSGTEGAIWDSVSKFSAMTFALSVLMFILYGILGQPGSAIGGLVQRVFLAVPWIWVEGVSVKFFRLQDRQ